MIQSINPLADGLSTFRPTTGYEDVKMVALARLAAPKVPVDPGGLAAIRS